MDEGLLYGFAPRELAAGSLVIADYRYPPGKQFDNCRRAESVGISVNLLAAERMAVLPNRKRIYITQTEVIMKLILRLAELLVAGNFVVAVLSRAKVEMEA